MFVLRYAAENDRKGAEPWSIRKCALYHQVRLSDKRSLYILISPYQHTEAEEMLVQWLQGVSTVRKYQQQLMRPAAMLLASHLYGWRQYMKHYEREVTHMVSTKPSRSNRKTPLTASPASGIAYSAAASSPPRGSPRTT